MVEPCRNRSTSCSDAPILPRPQKLFDEVIRRGRLLVDDGLSRSEINGDDIDERAAHIDRHRSLAHLVDTPSARESQPTSRIRIRKWRE